MRKIYDIIPPSELKMEASSSGYFMKGALAKIICLLLIIGLNWAGLSAIGETISYFNDTENSNDNIYTAASLDFSLTVDDWTPSVKANNMMPGDFVNRMVNVINEGSLDFQYTVRVVKTGGDDDFCNALELTATLDGADIGYIGNLISFTYGPVVFAAPEVWVFTVTLPNSTTELGGLNCEFKFVFEGWQIDIVNYSDSGFTDIEELSNKLTSSGLKINKVYYDVDGQHGEEGKNEWVELYNPTNHDINLKNWVICDNDDCEIINPNKSIPSHGFALISHDNSTWNYWEVPDDVVKIHQLGGSFVYLNNDADMLILRNPNDYIVDQMNWGIPSESWFNYNSDVWNPGTDDVVEGHMLGRSPNGFDTDQPSDWKDFGLPSVHLDYPNGGQVWYVGRTYTLRWTATNPTGNDADLLIDLYYSADSGNTWANIVKGTLNDQEYDWRIPLFIGDYFIPSPNARIKVVAISPENFIVNDWDMSDEDFCPPIDFDLLTPEELELAKSLGLFESPLESGADETTVEEDSAIEEVPAIEESLIIEETGDETISLSEEPIILEENNFEEVQVPTDEWQPVSEITKDTTLPLEETKLEDIILPDRPDNQDTSDNPDKNSSDDPDNGEEILKQTQQSKTEDLILNLDTQETNNESE